jgi:hypothetical protein
MNLTIPINGITAARKLLTRLCFERFTLPVLTHVLAIIDNAGLTLAVTDLDHWLETRVTAIIGPFIPGRFLIPAEALKAAARSDKGSSAHFAFNEDADGITLTHTTSCCGLSVRSVYHLAATAEDFPARPVVQGRITALPKETSCKRTRRRIYTSSSAPVRTCSSQKTIEARYPGYQHVIPSFIPESVTVPEAHKTTLIMWLRSPSGKSSSVRLTWESSDNLTLTHRD